MKKGVGIADLKARLSEHLRAVKRGRTLTVLDRDTPVAEIVPVGKRATGALEVRNASRRARDLPAPPPSVAPTDSLAVLLADRGRR
ncbi:MAG: type II toxin-antitoxin system Phd/YefM family antitoxin [Vicinamibacterales bacterium]